jgi:hypothetical protein
MLKVLKKPRSLFFLITSLIIVVVVGSQINQAKL